LAAAKQKTQALREQKFWWTVVSAIEGRLEQMEQTCAAAAQGVRPSREERERCLSVGVIAIRSIYAADRELCQLLLALANAFDAWTQLPYAHEPADVR
jgi:hypothetical protein